LSIRVLAGLEDKVFQERVNNNEITCRSFLPGEGVAGRVFASGEAVFLNEIDPDSSFVESASSYVKSIACIPMHVYNDTFGHTAGDKVLKAVGEYLHASIRDVDSVGRYGGEEFVLLLPETDKAAAIGLAERLRKGIAAMAVGKLPKTTMSMGIATFPEDGRTPDELLRKADAALYAAKEKGRNRVVGYTGAISMPGVK
jgi:diguanylate cyclase (GGDEF)-like protein